MATSMKTVGISEEDAIDPKLLKILKENGYCFFKVMPNGEIAALGAQIFTVGLFIGLDETGYRTRFCFETAAQALTSLLAWDGKGFPPGWWVKQKPEDISNPLLGEENDAAR